MFIKWYRKGGKVHHLIQVVKVELVSTGDVQIHHTLDGKIVTTTLVRGMGFDFLTIEQELK